MRAIVSVLGRILRHKLVHWLLSVAFLGAVAVGFVNALHGQGEAVRLALTELRLAALLGSLVLTVGSLALAFGAWWVLLTEMGSRLGFRAAARMFLSGHLGTYLPGTGWPLVIQLHQGRRFEVPPRRVLTAFVLAMAGLTSTGLTVGLMAAPGLLGGHTLWLLAPAGFLLAAVIRPDLLRRGVVWALRVARRPEPMASLASAQIRRAFLYSLLSWGANGLGLWLLAVSLGAPGWESLPACLGAMALAVLAGSFLPTAPGGLGPRELVLMLTLATFLPAPAALVVTVASRLVHTVADLLPAGLVLLTAVRAPAPPPVGSPVRPADLPRRSWPRRLRTVARRSDASA